MITQFTYQHILYFILLNIGIIISGYGIVKSKLLWPAWAMFILGVVIINFIFDAEHPLIRVLALIATTFTGMKVITVAETYRHIPLGLTFYQWLVFAVGWVGMRPQAFETLGQGPLPNAWALIRFGLSRLIIGSVVIFIAHRIAHFGITSYSQYLLISALALVGLSLILHFGLLNISAGMWRLRGAATYVLFRQPASAKSLAEFWSKRWNLAFTEMTSIAVFRPFKAKFGATPALIAAFVFSGLLHELALSVPVKNGYGLPLLYFLVQAVLVIIEKILISNNINIFRNVIVGKLWLFIGLVAPMPLLFHEAFIKQVVWPLVGLHN